MVLLGKDIVVGLVGIKEPTDEDRLMLDVLNACKKAGVSIPDEVLDHFGNDFDPELGGTVDLLLFGPQRCVEGFFDRVKGVQGFYVDLSKLPKTVKRIKFWAYSGKNT